MTTIKTEPNLVNEYLKGKPLVNKQRGEFAVKLSGEWIILHSTVTNICLFETLTGEGIYPACNRLVGLKNFKLTDLMTLVYCFSNNKDTPGFSLNDIGEKVRTTSYIDSALMSQEFVKIIFNHDELLELSEEDKTLLKTDEVVKSKKKKTDTLTTN